MTAIEKGERQICPSEIVRLAERYGLGLGDILRAPAPGKPLTVQFRAVLAPDAAAETQVAPAVDDFERFCEDYAWLEDACHVRSPRRYPPPYPTDGPSPRQAGADAATAERNRLGFGDGPIPDLRVLLEADVGLRVFCADLGVTSRRCMATPKRLVAASR